MEAKYHMIFRPSLVLPIAFQSWISNCSHYIKYILNCIAYNHGYCSFTVPEYPSLWTFLRHYNKLLLNFLVFEVPIKVQNLVGKIEHYSIYWKSWGLTSFKHMKTSGLFYWKKWGKRFINQICCSWCFLRKCDFNRGTVKFYLSFLWLDASWLYQRRCISYNPLVYRNHGSRSPISEGRWVREHSSISHDILNMRYWHFILIKI